jgi:hypothetical protein
VAEVDGIGYAERMKLFIAVGLLSLGLASGQSGEAKRFVTLTVSDAQGRAISGLEQEHFVVTGEGNSRLAITGFRSPGTPMTVAFVTTGPLPDRDILGEGDEMLQAGSFADALQVLENARNARRVIILVGSVGSGEEKVVPAAVQLIRTDAVNLSKSVADLRHQYRLEVKASPVDVAVKQPSGLPALRWNRTN